MLMPWPRVDASLMSFFLYSPIPQTERPHEKPESWKRGPALILVALIFYLVNGKYRHLKNFFTGRHMGGGGSNFLTIFLNFNILKIKILGRSFGNFFKTPDHVLPGAPKGEGNWGNYPGPGSVRNPRVHRFVTIPGPKVLRRIFL